jgi:hypothetical protein
VVLFGIIFCDPLWATEVPAKLYNPKGRRDPFIALVGSSVRSTGNLLSVEGPEDLNVEGIAFDPAGSVVVVNGSVMKEGETVGNVKVVRVGSTNATFEVNGFEFVKEVYPGRPQETR